MEQQTDKSALVAGDANRVVEITALYRHLQRAFEHMVERRPAWARTPGSIQQYEDYLEEVFSPDHPEAVKNIPPEQAGWLDLEALARTGLHVMLLK